MFPEAQFEMEQREYKPEKIVLDSDVTNTEESLKTAEESVGADFE